MSDLTFTKHETYGYGLNGKQFTVAQGNPTRRSPMRPPPAIAAAKGLLGTKMQILAGMNGNTAKCEIRQPPLHQGREHRLVARQRHGPG